MSLLDPLKEVTLGQDLYRGSKSKLKLRSERGGGR